VIERLRVGDLVVTEAGALEPIKGVGRNVLTKQTGTSWDESEAPVRVAQSAISAGVPARDLCLSPDHALFIDGYLIPVKYLVNGVTITQDVSALDLVEYIHLEFERHEIFYAEGTAIESLLVNDAHQITGDFAEYDRDESCCIAGAMTPYAPLLGYFGGRQEAVALARFAVYPWIDVRDRIQVFHDRLAARAKVMQASATNTALAA
jgi:hypothetical protein